MATPQRLFFPVLLARPQFKLIPAAPAPTSTSTLLLITVVRQVRLISPSPLVRKTSSSTRLLVRPPPIGDVLIEADGGFATTNLTVADGMVFNAESFTQENANAGGTTTFGGLITLADSDPAAAAPQDADFTFTGVNLLLKGVGNNDIEDLMTVTNSGTFTTETNVALVVDTFTQNGTGSNVIGGNITADSDGAGGAADGSGDITFAETVTLNSTVVDADIAFSTTSNSNINLNDAVNSLLNTDDESITFSAEGGTGDITIDGVVNLDNAGVGTGDITISVANNVTFNDTVDAENFDQLAGTGLTLFNDDAVFDFDGTFAFTGSI